MRYRFDDLIDQFNTSGDFVVGVSGNETMKIFFSIFGVLIWSGLAFLDTAFASDADLCAAIPLHLLQTITTRTDKQTEEIDLRELLDRDVDLLGWSL